MRNDQAKKNGKIQEIIFQQFPKSIVLQCMLLA
jgi:hypothetical protein